MPWLSGRPKPGKPVDTPQRTVPRAFTVSSTVAARVGVVKRPSARTPER